MACAQHGVFAVSSSDRIAITGMGESGPSTACSFCADIGLATHFFRYWFDVNVTVLGETVPSRRVDARYRNG